MYRKHAATPALALALAAAGASQAQEINGERLFRQQCASCHSIESGQNRVGPSLAGISGRNAGSVEGARYTPALRNSKVVWDAETLERFLANPRQFIPGTSMFISVPNETERRALVEYLTAR